MATPSSQSSALGDTALAVVIGIAVMLAGTLPRNFLFAVNLKLMPEVPWAVPITGLYLWFFWRYLSGRGQSSSTGDTRRASLRAYRIPARTWVWALIAGAAGIVALVIALQLANRMVVLPPQALPDMAGVPRSTLLSLLLFAAPVAGVIEEAAFRGYMQGPIERHYGFVIAVLITGTMFAVAHLDFTPVLWPYYVLVSALYGGVTYLSGSILPAIVLHAAGNIYSNLDLYLHGQAEWQAPASRSGMLWATGPDRAFWIALVALVVMLGITWGAFVALDNAGRKHRTACGGRVATD